MIIVYTGNGQGKTSAAAGMAMRAKGAGKKILIIQFLKPEKPKSFEIAALSECGVEVKGFGSPRFINKETVSRQDKIKAHKGWDFFVKNYGKFDLIILDEINVACEFELLEAADLTGILKKAGKGKNLVLTGRWAPKEFLKIADIVTEMKEVKYDLLESKNWWGLGK